jgi:hypothetical protein
VHVNAGPLLKLDFHMILRQSLDTENWPVGSINRGTLVSNMSTLEHINNISVQKPKQLQNDPWTAHDHACKSSPKCAKNGHFEQVNRYNMSTKQNFRISKLENLHQPNTTIDTQKHQE